MKYISSEAEPITTNVAQDSPVPGQRLVIRTAGTGKAFSLTKLVFNRKLKTSTAVVKVYYTGNDLTFSATQIFGSITTNTTTIIKGEQPLTGGANYFWVRSENGNAEIKSFDLGAPVYTQAWSDEFTADTINVVNCS